MFPYDNTPNPYQQSQELIQNQLRQLMTPQSAANNQTARHIVKVNGRTGAEAYYLPPNSDDILMDLNDPIAWVVQTDGAGYKTVTPYDISLHKEVKQEDHIKSMEERITKLEEAILNGKSNTTTTVPKSKSGTIRNDAGSRSDA